VATSWTMRNQSLRSSEIHHHRTYFISQVQWYEKVILSKVYSSFSLKTCLI
jgi:hypothetical protein